MYQAPLIISQFGESISLSGERVVIKTPKESPREIPLSQISELILERPQMSITGSLLQALTKHHIPILFLKSDGSAYAHLTPSPFQRGLGIRRAQYLASDNSVGAHIALQLIHAKLLGQAIHLKSLRRRRRLSQSVRNLLKDGMTKLTLFAKEVSQLPDRRLEVLRGRLLSVEGHGARVYWNLLQEVIPSHYHFVSRTKRGAKDLINASLNYGYGVLNSAVSSAIHRAALDAECGFLHADHLGRNSLTCDLIEPLRAIVVDQAIVSLALGDKSLSIEDHLLTGQSKRLIAVEVLKVLDQSFMKDDLSLRERLLLDTRGLASSLLDEQIWCPSFTSLYMDRLGL